MHIHYNLFVRFLAHMHCGHSKVRICHIYVYSKEPELRPDSLCQLHIIFLLLRVLPLHLHHRIQIFHYYTDGKILHNDSLAY